MNAGVIEEDEADRAHVGKCFPGQCPLWFKVGATNFRKPPLRRLRSAQPANDPISDYPSYHLLGLEHLETNRMKLATTIALVALFLPTVASAQYRDLDAALSNLERGFGSGDVDAITSGVSDDGQVQLQFPGLSDQSGLFGRDQAAYLLDGLFYQVKPSGFELVSYRGVRAEGQYYITARWHVADGLRDLYITLKRTDDRWEVVSIRSA
jgi:hypothetical protein